MRLIDADALKADYGMKDDCADCEKELRGKVKSCEYEHIYTKMDFCGWIDSMPTIEPERKKGTWLVHLYKLGIDRYECDQCQGRCDMGYRYCPNCGADMRGDSE